MGLKPECLGLNLASAIFCVTSVSYFASLHHSYYYIYKMGITIVPIYRVILNMK